MDSEKQIKEKNDTIINIEVKCNELDRKYNRLKENCKRFNIDLGNLNKEKIKKDGPSYKEVFRKKALLSSDVKRIKLSYKIELTDYNNTVMKLERAIKNLELGIEEKNRYV